jgi:anion-transporting  ArsA/GET3 family ATPase
MKRDNKAPTAEDFPSQPSSRDLRGRQSVRATFKLTAKAIETMSAVSVHLGIKQKSLFDHLIDDLESLERIARQMGDATRNLPSRMQKTFVLSRRTLSCLDQTAKQYAASRDALVEYSIQRLQPVIAKEKKRHAERKRLLKKFNEFLSTAETILTEAEQALGPGDPVFDQLEKAILGMLNTRDDIAAFIEKGKIIESF